MAGTKISGLSTQTGAGVASGDLFVTVDISDTTTVPAGAGGSDKSITAAQLAIAMSALASDPRLMILLRQQFK